MKYCDLQAHEITVVKRSHW